MNTIYFTPGPSQLYETYQHHLMQAMNLQLGSINHRSNQFRSIYQHTDEQLRILMDIPSSHAIFFASSATEIWEKIILNCVDQYSFHLTNGAFSNKFYDFAKLLKKSPIQFNVDEGLGFDVNDIHIPDDAELICTTQNETSTGVQLPLEDLEAIKKRHPNKLLCSDLVSVAPYSPINYELLDCSFFSVQKAFGMPPGLGVWIANQACLEKSLQLEKSNTNIGAHHTLSAYFKNYKTFETPSTPNVIAIYILGKIAEDMNTKGLKNIREEIDIKANMIYHFAENKDGYSLFVNEAKHRSKTVVVINTTQASADIIQSLKPFYLAVGSGYGKLNANQIRIANFPATSIADMENLLEHL